MDWAEAEARAKVNLRLRIFPPGPDGYHPLETLFCRISLADRVRVRLTTEPKVVLRLSGSESAPEGHANLAVQAAERYLNRTDQTCGVELELEKVIPGRSGLGGGSSDAGTVLRLLNELTGEVLDRNELAAVGAELGADVPFFVLNAPLALGWQRGDRVLELAGPEPWPIVVARPALDIGTSTAYRLWDEKRDPRDLPEDGLAASWKEFSAWERIRSLARNDFEPVLVARYPALRSLKAALQQTAPFLALLSGSGSAFFAVYEDEARRDMATEVLRELEGVRTWKVTGPA